MRTALFFFCVTVLVLELGCSKSNQPNANTSTPADPNTQSAASPGPMNPTTQTDPSTNGAPTNPTMMPPPSDSSDMSLQMMATDFHSALLRGNKEQLEKFLSDGYKGTQADGSVMNKQQTLAAARKSEQMYSMEAGKPQISGDTATVTGKITLTSMEQAKTDGQTFKFTDTYRKQGGKWQVVSTKISNQ